MRSLVILLLVFININCLSAQVDRTTTIDKTTTFVVDRPRLMLKWSPLSLVSFTAPTAQLSVEYPIGKTTQHFSLEHDLGLVIADPSYSEEFNSGFRVGTRVKYYFRPANETYDNWYISVMARYTRREGTADAFFRRAGGAYTQLLDYTQIDEYSGVYLEGGYLGRFGAKSRFIFESLFGIGGLHVTEKFEDIPDDAETPFNFNDNFFEFPTNRTIPSVILVLKIGYILR